MFRFGIGHPVRSAEIEGIVDARAEYSDGKKKYLVKGKYQQQGVEPPRQWIDEDALEDAVPAAAPEPPAPPAD